MGVMDEKWMIPYDGLSKQGSARAAEMLLCNSSARYWWSGESSNISNGLGSILSLAAQVNISLRSERPSSALMPKSPYKSPTKYMRVRFCGRP